MSLAAVLLEGRIYDQDATTGPGDYCCRAGRSTWSWVEERRDRAPRLYQTV